MTNQRKFGNSALVISVTLNLILVLVLIAPSNLETRYKKLETKYEKLSKEKNDIDSRRKKEAEFYATELKKEIELYCHRKLGPPLNQDCAIMTI